MRKFFFLLFALLFCLQVPSWGQEPTTAPSSHCCRGHAAHSSVYDSLAFSMALWGAGLAAGIGLLCALVKNSTAAHAHNSQ